MERAEGREFDVFALHQRLSDMTEDVFNQISRFSARQPHSFVNSLGQISAGNSLLTHIKPL